MLAPGGELYCADAHPGFYVLEEFAGKLLPTYDYWTPPDRPLEFNNATTYTGDPTVMTHQSTREWIHPLSAILGALIDSGLTITMFREHEVLPWQGVPMLVPAPDGWWRLPDGHPRIPLSFSVRAKKRVVRLKASRTAPGQSRRIEADSDKSGSLPIASELAAYTGNVQ